MPQFLPLFVPNSLLELVDKEKVERDSLTIKDYFEGTDSQTIKKLLSEQNGKWKTYLEELAKPLDCLNIRARALNLKKVEKKKLSKSFF